LKATILTVGDEVLIGQVVNTNAAFLSKTLFSIGIPVERVITIPDTEKDITREISKAISEYDVVISSGGLGPTHDDITVKCIAKVFKKKLVHHQQTFERIKNIFERRKLQLPANIKHQAMMPEGALLFENKTGTAPGILILKGKKIFCAMPGVPHELEYITVNELIPMLKKQKGSGGKVLLQKTLHTIGIGESFLSQRLGDLDKLLVKDNNSSVKLAFLPSNYEVRLRITVGALTIQKAEKLLKCTLEIVKTKAKNFIYSYSEKPIEEELGRLLAKRRLTISIAESCTGGLVCSKLTNVSGSSAYVMAGAVTYSNNAKIKMLGVKKTTLVKHGAVSRETAIKMAEGIRKLAKTDIGISTTGIAGPAGAVPGKPVGLVWIGYSNREKSFAKEFIFTKDRIRNKEAMSKMALEVVRRELLDIK